MEVTILEADQTTHNFYNFLERMISNLLMRLGEAPYGSNVEFSKFNVIRNKGFYLVQFTYNNKDFEIEYTIDQILSYVTEQLQNDIHSASLSTGWRS